MAKNSSYKIKHDYLFKDDDTDVVIPTLNDSIKSYSNLNVSALMNADNERKFEKLVKTKSNTIVIIDDIGLCINPESERYKRFIIRCVYRKLKELNYNIYM